MPESLRPRLRRELLGAYVTAVFSVPGVLFSSFLTVLKFRNEFTCEKVLLATCTGGCELALRDSWSVIWNVPLTVYGASLFTLALFVSAVIMLSPRLAPRMRLPSLVLGWAALLTAIALGVYARFGLGQLCSLCAVLYCACVGLFLGAWLINPAGPIGGLRDRARGTAMEAATVLLVISTCFAALTGMQYNRYRTEVLESRKTSLLTCAEKMIRDLPPTSFVRAATHEPEVVLGLFIDLSCPHCRIEYAEWLDYWTKHQEFLEFKVFHFPMDPQCHGGNSPGASHNSACIGALALECMLQRAPTRAEDILLDMFAMQDTGEPFFEIAKLESMAAKYGFDDLKDCVNADPEVERRVSHHVSFARSIPLDEAPALVVAPVRRGKLSERGFPISGPRSSTLIEDMIEDARKRARSP